MSAKTHTLSYYALSELFGSYDAVLDALYEACDLGGIGDAAYTLVYRTMVLDYLDEVDTTTPGYAAARARVANLPPSSLIQI